MEGPFITGPSTGRAAEPELSLSIDVKMTMGLGGRTLRAVIAADQYKRLGVPALCPEEVGPVFERIGLERRSFFQLQMALDL